MPFRFMFPRLWSFSLRHSNILVTTVTCCNVASHRNLPDLCVLLDETE